LLAQAELVVFLHPIRWYSMPSLLKEWVDSVLQPGWAYGPGGAALRGKGYWLATTTGSPEEAYGPGERHGYRSRPSCRQFEQTAALCGMQWWPPHILHGANGATQRDHRCPRRRLPRAPRGQFLLRPPGRKPAWNIAC
jgi:putative NADPH-quinone reductase